MTTSDKSLIPKTFVLLAVSVLMAGCAQTFTEETTSAESRADERNIPVVEVVQARFGSLPLSERLIGTVIAQNQVALFSEISGRIVRVAAKDGDFVRRGDPLVFLEDNQYREQLQQAQANHRVNQAALRQAQARFEELEAQYKRTRLLAEEGLSSQLEVETLEAQLASARASVELAEARIEESAAAIEETKAVLSRTVIRAPITGTIGQRNAEVGMQVTSSARLFTIGNLDQLRVAVALTEEMLTTVGIGQTARVNANTSGQRILGAKLSRISPFLDPVTRSTEAEIDIQNEGGILKPGMSVSVEILYGESRQATLVPTSAIYTHPDAGQEGVYIAPSLDPEFQTPQRADSRDPPPLSPPTRIEFRPVDVIARGRMEVAVAGIEPETWIVTVGQDLLTEGGRRARVRVSSWERTLALQGLQREDLLLEALKTE